MVTRIKDAQVATGKTIRVAGHDELKQRGVIVVAGDHRRIAVFADGDSVYAVENNCPHMGFPLDRGTVRDGMLTCHWHQARFDLRSGCTFDLWADDVPGYACWIENGVVLVAAESLVPADEAYHQKRLRRGIEQNVGLVQAKSLLALLEGGASLDRITSEVVDYAQRNLNNYSEGMIRLGCMINLFPFVSSDTAYLGLYYSVRQIAQEASNSVPRRDRQALHGKTHDHTTLKRWLVQWVQTRHRDGAERTLLTGIEQLDNDQIADLVFCGASERLYADGGHLLESCNKAFELLELLGKDCARSVFPLLVPSMVEARGREESTDWHHPIEIVEPLRSLEQDLNETIEQGKTKQWAGDPDLLGVILGDDPLAIIRQLKESLGSGATPETLAQTVAYAAAMRLARFATSNEVTDWFNPQHTFIFTNGTYQAVRRSATADVVRAIFQGAIAIYNDRYLNVPAARLPSERQPPANLPEDGGELQKLLLDTLDQRGSIELSADIVSRYLQLELPFENLVDTLVFATVREDLDFHSLQVLDAGVRQCAAWGPGEQRQNIMVGVIRNLAAHCPTRRAGQQTSQIAQRLHRGDKVFEED